jgi:polar amino acid transport system ATP-binding protein
MSEPLIRVRGLCKSYGENEILKNIDVDINRGDVISIIGGSGCGKSTFTRCINFLDPATSGEVWFDGEKISGDAKSLQALRRKIGMVFQSFNLFSNMTIVENAMLGPVDLLGKSRQEAYDRAMELLDTVGLAHKALSYPDELSGGQKQRAAIARTLAMDPEVIIFDEPTSALDPTMVGEVLGVMMSLAEQGATMLIVTHEMNFARNVSNRIFYMDEKGIYEDGTPEQVFEKPRKPKTRDFILRVHSFTYDIHHDAFDLFELVGKAGAFMRKQLFDDKRIQRVLHILDETIGHCILSTEGTKNTRVTLRYSEKTDEFEVVFTDLDGSAIYPFDSMYDVARKIVETYSLDVANEPGRLSISMGAGLKEVANA